jgi:hypothetical protein
MSLIKRVFFDTEKDDMGHFSVYEKTNGNTYITFFLEERYHAFREYSLEGKMIDGKLDLGFKMLNKITHDERN